MGIPSSLFTTAQQQKLISGFRFCLIAEMARVLFQNYTESEMFVAVSVQTIMLIKRYVINSLQLLEIQQLADKLIRQTSKISVMALLT